MTADATGASSPFVRPIVLIALVELVLAGCARKLEVVYPSTRIGFADVEVLPEETPMPEIRIETDQRPTPEGAPATLRQDSPVYPDSALDDEVACTARVLYHIETDGRATLVRLDWEAAPPEAHRESFEAAIGAAIAGWRFQAAFRQIFRELPDGSFRFEKKPIPKAASAVIRFRVEDGKPIVD